MKLPFIKLEGLGNCYIFVEAAAVKKTSLSKLASMVSDVSTGIGSDGLIAVSYRKKIYTLRFFNKDGSEAELCGNGLRQAALYAKARGGTGGRKFTFHTLAGDFPAEILDTDSIRAMVRTELGSPDFSPAFVKNGNKLAFDIQLSAGKGTGIKADCVSMGNPHAVVWVNDFDFDWEKLGRILSRHPKFSSGANIHFCHVVNRKRFRMRIYERGSGTTMACGSGAAASLAAGVMKGKLNKTAVAEMPGGKLKLIYDISQGLILQEGPVSIVSSGVYYY